MVLLFVFWNRKDQYPFHVYVHGLFYSLKSLLNELNEFLIFKTGQSEMPLTVRLRMQFDRAALNSF